MFRPELSTASNIGVRQSDSTPTCNRPVQLPANSGTSQWVPLKESTFALSSVGLIEASETSNGDWGQHGAAGLCMLKPDSNGKCSILLLQSADGNHDANIWSLPGGAIQTQKSSIPEDPLHCALRETHEEVKIIPPGQVWTNPIVMCNSKTGFTYHYYLCVLNEASTWNPSLRGEHKAYAWQALEHAHRKPQLHEGLQSAIGQMASHWGQAAAERDINLGLLGQPSNNSPHITQAQFTLNKLQISGSESILSNLDQPLSDTHKQLIQHAASPTQLWLQRHPEETPPGWTIAQMEALPVDISTLKRIELAHAKTHVAVYHAFMDKLLPVHWTGEVLMKLMCQHESTTTQDLLTHLSFHRDPFTANKNRYHNIPYLKEYIQNNSALDNGKVGTFALISCNPSLFQNSDVDAMESTADYLHDAINVAPPDLEELISNMLREQLSKHVDSRQITTACEDILELCSNDENSLSTSKKASVLMQILVPHGFVNEITYISQSNGIPDDDNPNALDTLIRLKSPDAANSVPNTKSLQVRILSSALQDPNLAPHLRVKLFSRYTESRVQSIKAGIESIIKKLNH